MQMLDPRLDFGTIAQNPTESVRPDLWPDHAWIPALGNQGLVLRDVVGGVNATLSGVAPAWDGDRVWSDKTAFGVLSSTISLSGNWTIVLDALVLNSLYNILVCTNDYTGFFYLYPGLRARFENESDVAKDWTGDTAFQNVRRKYAFRAASNTIDFVLDGESQGVQGITTTLNISRLLGGYGDPNLGFGGYAYSLYIYRRALSYSQISDLSVSPLLPFRRAPQVSYFVAAAGLAIPILINQARRRRT